MKAANANVYNLPPAATTGARAFRDAAECGAGARDDVSGSGAWSTAARLSSVPIDEQSMAGGMVLEYLFTVAAGGQRRKFGELMCYPPARISASQAHRRFRDSALRFVAVPLTTAQSLTAGPVSTVALWRSGGPYTPGTMFSASVTYRGFFSGTLGTIALGCVLLGVPLILVSFVITMQWVALWDDVLQARRYPLTQVMVVQLTSQLDHPHPRGGPDVGDPVDFQFTYLAVGRTYAVQDRTYNAGDGTALLDRYHPATMAQPIPALARINPVNAWDAHIAITGPPLSLLWPTAERLLLTAALGLVSWRLCLITAEPTPEEAEEARIRKRRRQAQRRAARTKGEEERR